MDLTNFTNSIKCFLVSCAWGRGHESPVRVMAFCKICLSFFKSVHLKIIWLIVCSSRSLYGHVEFKIILNLCKYGLHRPWPVTIAVNSRDTSSIVFILSFIYGKNNLLNTPFVEPVHWSCHFVNNISFPSVVIVSLGFLVVHYFPCAFHILTNWKICLKSVI